MRTLNRNLTLLLGGQFISQIGDKFYALALAFWVLQTTGSPASMGMVLFASTLPSVVLGFFTGGFVDRYSRKAILVAADVVRALTILAVTAVYYLGGLSLAVIIAAQVVLSASAAFFNPAVLSTVPQIVPEERLGKANGMSQLLSGTANIAGPILGGLAVSYLGYEFVFAFNAASFIVSALCEAGLRLPKVSKADGAKPQLREQLAGGYAYILSKRNICVLLGVVAIVHFFVGAVQVLMPVLANSLSGSGAENLGYIETAFGAGIMACALLLNRLNFKGRESFGMFAGITAIGAVITAAGLLSSLGVRTVLPYLAAFFLLSAAVILVSTNYTVILQKTVDNAMAGRVFGIVGSVGNFTLPISMLVFGWMLNSVSTGVIAMLCGGFVLLICLALALAYRAKIIPLPNT